MVAGARPLLLLGLGVTLALAGAATPAATQGVPCDRCAGWLPDVRWFDGPVADPLEPRVAGAFILTDLFAVRPGRPPERPPFAFAESAADLERDLQAVVAVGGTLPLWGKVVDREVAVVVAGQLGVVNRFRMELSSRDDVGGDWVVALPVELRLGEAVSGRLRLSHRSSHLGDEVAMRGQIQRLEFSYEALDALVAVRPGASTRLYGGGTLILASNTYRADYSDDPREPLIIRDFGDRFVVQIGGELAPAPHAGGLAP
ncbi:MAG TPA: DUF1207 domain-containing protein, partial [Longimicrobiales bacterium]|nr:DUF1207 domain-containing protein [Longimicrobiales bacterium]